MKYILNKTSVRTSNNYLINDLELEYEMPNIKNFGNYSIDTNNYKEYDDNYFESKIGFSFNKCHKLDIDIDKDTTIEYCINEDILIDIITLNINSNSKINIKYTSKNNISHHMKLIINSNNNAIVNLINMIDKTSSSFVAIEVNNKSNLEINFIDLSGNIRINNYYNESINNTTCTFNNIYFGNNDLIDINYYASNELCSENHINVYGILNGNSNKRFKGIIDFRKGASKSIGDVSEDVTLLSNTSISRSLPILLCHEEDVIGNHSVSTGKLDKDKIFYLMSKGLSLEESEKMLIKAKFNHIVDKLDDDIALSIEKYLDEII